MTPRQETIGPHSVLQPWHTIPIQVRRLFTTVDGQLVDKADAGLIAAGMVKKYPVYVLGTWDREGGYAVGLNINPPKPGTYSLTVFVNGAPFTSHNVCTPYSALNEIQNQLQRGDICHVFTNDLANPTYFAWIIYSANTAPLASILANLSTTQKDRRLGRLFCDDINFVASDYINQLSEVWNYYHVDNIGRPNVQQISYAQFNDPMQVLPNVLTFKTNFEVDQYIGIATYIIPSIDEMTFNINTQIRN